jgi:hypothetical protein
MSISARYICIALATVCAASAATLSAPYNSTYALVSLGSVAGVPGPYGGITFLDNNHLLLGGSANNGAGVIDEVPLTRDVNGHIISFGAVAQFSTAPQIDGGLQFGPGGVLFFTGYPSNTVGQIKPGSTSPDKTTNVTADSITSSVGTLAFVPAGYNGAGNMIIGSYNGGGFCKSTVTTDGSGTYNIGNCTNQVSIGGGPEGLVYVPLGSADFASPSVLIAQYGTGNISAYTIDANGLPVAGSQTNFISGLNGAEGATIDPVTGDFLFSTFNGGNQIIQVQGFVAPPSNTPEPATWALISGGLLVAGLLRRRFSV